MIAAVISDAAAAASLNLLVQMLLYTLCTAQMSSAFMHCSVVFAAAVAAAFDQMCTHTRALQA
jgi:hypothetical protein